MLVPLRRRLLAILLSVFAVLLATTSAGQGEVAKADVGNDDSEPEEERRLTIVCGIQFVSCQVQLASLPASCEATAAAAPTTNDDEGGGGFSLIQFILSIIRSFIPFGRSDGDNNAEINNVRRKLIFFGQLETACQSALTECQDAIDAFKCPPVPAPVPVPVVVPVPTPAPVFVPVVVPVPTPAPVFVPVVVPVPTPAPVPTPTPPCTGVYTATAFQNALNAASTNVLSPTTIVLCADFKTQQEFTIKTNSAFNVVCNIASCQIDAQGATRILVGAPALASFTNVRFANGFVNSNTNTGNLNGGALMFSGTGGVRFNNCVFSNNRAERGAVLYSSDGADVQADNCVFSQNQAGLNGGVFYIQNGDVTLTGSTLSENFAGNNGGVLYMLEGFFTAIGTSFTSNQANGVRNACFGWPRCGALHSTE